MPPAAQIVISPPESARPSESFTARESDVPYRDGVLADVAQIAVATDDASLGDSQSTIAPVQADWLEAARKKRTVLYASVGAAAVVTAIAGTLMLRPHAGGNSASAKGSAAQRTTVARAPVGTAPATVTGSTAAGAAAVVGATRGDSLRVASVTPQPTAPAAQPEQRASEAAPPVLRAPHVDVHVRPMNIPTITVPRFSAAPSVDSSARSATERPRVSDTGRTGTGERGLVPTSPEVEKASVENAITPAKIIGPVPAPRFPDALRSRQREGQVVVRFIVDEFGRVDVASMIVERSDHELFTAAVREILPRFRFEPARTHAPESKPVAGWVSVPFRFTTNR